MFESSIAVIGIDFILISINLLMIYKFQKLKYEKIIVTTTINEPTENLFRFSKKKIGN